MNILNALERKFGKYAISNLTYYLIGGQVLAFILTYFYPHYANLLPLQGNLVLKGQVWRLFTMLFVPISESPIWAALTWYLYYLFGTALETEWGTFRYTIFLFISYLATILSSFIFPEITVGNGYLYASIFLAFAYLFPDYQLYIFFVIPVKVKWLALLMWLGLFASFIFGSISTKVLILISIGNFLLFFGKEISFILISKLHFVSAKSGQIRDSHQAYMKCSVCGATEHDRKIFYYCHKCVPETCFCEDHLKGHIHKK